MGALLNAPPPSFTPLLPPSPRPRELKLQLLSNVKGGSSKWATLGVTLALHGSLVAAVLIVPLFYEDRIDPTSSVRAFFVAPAVITPPPPPPPPPAAVPAAVRRPAAPTQAPPTNDDVLRAPIEMPDALPEPEQALDLGIEGGVAGGVEGGVPGGVIGGVVGGLNSAPAPSRVVRIGGNIKAPKVLHRVDPVYPPIARAARITGTIQLRALVDEHGIVKDVQVVRGVPMLSEAALEAVRQWRYQPLLLNGIPYEFELTVKVNFGLSS